MKMKLRILRCIHYLQTALIVKMKKPLKKNINFHISDQMNFQEFNNNILSVHSAPPIVQQQISNPFFLKWVSGTTVSKCYGCNGSIPNPPINMLDNLIVARKDIRHYRDRNTGQLQFSSQPQNVHFHLNLRCIHAKYPTFNPCHLTIDTFIYPYLQPNTTQVQVI